VLRNPADAGAVIAQVDGVRFSDRPLRVRRAERRAGVRV
jgi:hypothetical protein